MSYLDKKQRSSNNLISKKNCKGCQYAATVVINYDKIGKNPGRITQIKPFTDKHNGERRNYSLEKDD